MSCFEMGKRLDDRRIGLLKELREVEEGLATQAALEGSGQIVICWLCGAKHKVPPGEYEARLSMLCGDPGAYLPFICKADTMIERGPGREGKRYDKHPGCGSGLFVRSDGHPNEVHGMDAVRTHKTTLTVK